jgi:hypothetical protein
MEWERAKNIILVAFVILNTGLASLLFIEDRRYTLDNDRIASIHTVLSNNYINLYTVPMRRFPPMRHLDISGFYYNINELLHIFFEDNVAIIPDNDTEERHYIFRQGNRKMEISNGFIFFDNLYGLRENRTEAQHISRPDAIAEASRFVEAHFPDFVQDIVFDGIDGEGVHVRFLQEYRGHLIYSNLIEVFVVPGGISWIEMRFGRVIGYGPEPRMIFAPDEVLLTFMQGVRYRALEEPMFIMSMDIVYRKEYASNQEGHIYPAVPFYRIFVQGEDMPFLINAFTNVTVE